MTNDRRLWEMVKRTVRPLHLPRAPYIPQAIPAIPIVKHTLDLHGLTVHSAYHEVLAFVLHEHQRGALYGLVITGKSGQIAKEFPHWLARNPHVKSCVPVNGGGAYEIAFKPK